jgi:hypothetical protein
MQSREKNHTVFPPPVGALILPARATQVARPKKGSAHVSQHRSSHFRRARRWRKLHMLLFEGFAAVVKQNAWQIEQTTWTLPTRGAPIEQQANRCHFRTGKRHIAQYVNSPSKIWNVTSWMPRIKILWLPKRLDELKVNGVCESCWSDLQNRLSYTDIFPCSTPPHLRLAPRGEQEAAAKRISSPTRNATRACG